MYTASKFVGGYAEIDHCFDEEYILKRMLAQVRFHTRSVW